MFCFVQALQARLKQMSETESSVRAQLRDAKDHADLLEFRLLEVEELAKVKTSPVPII